MTKAKIAGATFAVGVLLLTLIAGYRALRPSVRPVTATTPPITPAPTEAAQTQPAAPTQYGFLYGRVVTVDGASYEGRLRFGAGEESFWDDYFNGAKTENSWATYVPPERRPKERRPIKIFGIKIAERERPIALDRPFMARFGDIARIEAHGREVRVTLKSGTMFNLDRFGASDFDDGVRVWDGTRGVVDLDSLRISTIELLPTPPLDAAPVRLHGTVRSSHGEFTGFIQWNRTDCVGSDELEGRKAEAELRLRFDTIRSIARRSRDGSLVTLLDGREIELTGTQEAGQGNRGVYVEDRRHGRVLISWDAFEHVDFSPGDTGPAYGDFPPGRPLTGSVTTRSGQHLTGRLVYDLDEGETVETLDAPFGGVDYTIPFGMIASIVPSGLELPGAQRARVTLRSGEELQLEHAGDLGDGNAGMLIFVEGRQSPEYVPWTDVEKVDLDREVGRAALP